MVVKECIAWSKSLSVGGSAGVRLLLQKPWRWDLKVGMQEFLAELGSLGFP